MIEFTCGGISVIYMAAFEMRSEVILRVPMYPARSLLILLLYS